MIPRAAVTISSSGTMATSESRTAVRRMALVRSISPRAQCRARLGVIAVAIPAPSWTNTRFPRTYAGWYTPLAAAPKRVVSAERSTRSTTDVMVPAMRLAPPNWSKRRFADRPALANGSASAVTDRSRTSMTTAAAKAEAVTVRTPPVSPNGTTSKAAMTTPAIAAAELLMATRHARPYPCRTTWYALASALAGSDAAARTMYHGCV